jgi:hypothetical protein
VSHADVSHAFPVVQEYQARVSLVQLALIVSLTTRSQVESSEHAAQYAVATGSIGAAPDDDPQPNARSKNPTQFARIIHTPRLDTRQRE